MLTKVLEYYSRKDVQEALLEISANREVVSVFKDGRFGNRPNMLVYPQDIIQEVKKGVVSFHGSVERWSNPMKLEPGLTKEDMDKLRIGFDIIIDPDVPDFEIGKQTVIEIIKCLKDHGLRNFSIKLTGGKGFHIGIPFEALPKRVNFKNTELLFPDLPRKVIEYIKHYIRDELRDRLLEIDTAFGLAKRVGKSVDEIVVEDGIDPFRIVEIDSMVISPRHLFRLPYSLHEKTMLVSLPIDEKRIEDITKEDAKPEKVVVEEKFLRVKRNLRDAKDLIIEALDWASRHEEETLLTKEIPKKTVKKVLKKIPEEYFPPCIKKILSGLSDGRKRSVFILINFLRNMGWEWEEIEKKLNEWNEKNKPPLRTNYLRTQLRWHMRQERNLLPPNCDNPNFYREISMNVCEPDEICQNVKNPIAYPFKKFKKRKR
ncbi:MAG: hypothetical protein J7K98_01240 [Candidatus Aenigmarchaeota archaeon]|nr:hypothetical protein [Candidatus Aenigmarchaeota archaeon]